MTFAETWAGTSVDRFHVGKVIFKQYDSFYLGAYVARIFFYFAGFLLMSLFPSSV